MTFFVLTASTDSKLLVQQAVLLVTVSGDHIGCLRQAIAIGKLAGVPYFRISSFFKKFVNEK